MFGAFRVWLNVSVDRYRGDDTDIWFKYGCYMLDRFGPRAMRWYMKSSFFLGSVVGCRWHLSDILAGRPVSWRHLFRPDMGVAQEWCDDVLAGRDVSL